MTFGENTRKQQQKTFAGLLTYNNGERLHNVFKYWWDILKFVKGHAVPEGFVHTNTHTHPHTPLPLAHLAAVLRAFISVD